MTKTNVAVPPAIPLTVAPTEVFELFAVVLFCIALLVELCCVILLVDDTIIVDGETDVVDDDTNIVDDDAKTVSSSVL